MHIHEYQAKRLLSAYGVPTPEGRLAATPGEAEQAARDLPGPVWVVKAQIHAGGRGKAGGVNHPWRCLSRLGQGRRCR